MQREVDTGFDVGRACGCLEETTCSVMVVLWWSFGDFGQVENSEGCTRRSITTQLECAQGGCFPRRAWFSHKGR